MFLLFDPVFQHDNLVFEELVKEPCEFHEGKLTSFIVLEEFYDAHVLFFETGIDHTIDLVSSHTASDELFDHGNINGAIVVSITSVIQNSAHVVKLIVVDQDIGEVLDCLLVVHGNFFDINLTVNVDVFLALDHRHLLSNYVLSKIIFLC